MKSLNDKLDKRQLLMEFIAQLVILDYTKLCGPNSEGSGTKSRPLYRMFCPRSFSVPPDKNRGLLNCDTVQRTGRMPTFQGEDEGSTVL